MHFVIGNIINRYRQKRSRPDMQGNLDNRHIFGGQCRCQIFGKMQPGGWRSHRPWMLRKHGLIIQLIICGHAVRPGNIGRQRHCPVICEAALQVGPLDSRVIVQRIDKTQQNLAARAAPQNPSGKIMGKLNDIIGAAFAGRLGKNLPMAAKAGGSARFSGYFAFMQGNTDPGSAATACQTGRDHQCIIHYNHIARLA